MGLVSTLILIMVISGTTQLHILNFALKYYDQMQAMPVYQASVMVAFMITGMVVFDEIRFYTGGQLVGIGMSIVFCIIGIKCITMKTKVKEREEVEEEAEAGKSHTV